MKNDSTFIRCLLDCIGFAITSCKMQISSKVDVIFLSLFYVLLSLFYDSGLLIYGNMSHRHTIVFVEDYAYISSVPLLRGALFRKMPQQGHQRRDSGLPCNHPIHRVI